MPLGPHTHTTAQAFATATTSVSLATYADVAGASISLGAGTWLVHGMCNGMAVNAAFAMNVAITDGANTVQAETTQNVPASGTASVNAWGSVHLTVVVSPTTTTSYKLRAARGNAAPTTTWVAGDGSGVGVANNASSNTDKGTVINAIRVG